MISMYRISNEGSAIAYVYAKHKSIAYWKAWDRWSKDYNIGNVLDLKSKNKHDRSDIKYYKTRGSLGTIK